MMINGAKEWADQICIVDGYSNDGTWEYLQQRAKKDKRIKIAQHTGANAKTINFGKARQKCYGLATGDFIFWMDADECLQDKALPILQQAMESDFDAFNVRYEHFYGDFAHVDASEPVHIGYVRFHKRFDSVRLDGNKNHALAQSKEFKKIGIMFEPVIYHCGYIRGMDKIFQAYYRNITMGSFHPPFYQTFWKEWHYNGTYPKRKFDMNLIPKAIRERFHIGIIVQMKKKEEGLKIEAEKGTAYTDKDLRDMGKGVDVEK